MSRLFVCERCAQERTASTSSGRLPRICDECDPAAARRRDRDRKDAPLAELERLRARVAELEVAERRVAELELELVFDHAAQAAASRVREPGRDDVSRAVVRLAHAKGRDETAQRLLELAGSARAWARKIGAEPRERPIELAAEEAAA